jgi:hypothetical protein
VLVTSGGMVGCRDWVFRSPKELAPSRVGELTKLVVPIPLDLAGSAAPLPPNASPTVRDAIDRMSDASFGSWR